MTDDEPRIYARHARACTICGPGITRVLQRYGVDPVDFGENGITVKRALQLANNNPLVVKVAQVAVQEWEAAHGKG